MTDKVPWLPGSDLSGPEILHATCVATDGKGVLILGPSGAGKSALALQLMALGATLVADDQTVVMRQKGNVFASCPPPLAGLIEARGVGILNAETIGPVPVVLIVDLSQTEMERLPPRRNLTLLGLPVDMLHVVHSGHFPAAILHYIKMGRAK